MKRDSGPVHPAVPKIVLRDSIEADLEAIVQFEQACDTAPFILPGDLDRHRADMADPGLRYLSVCERESGRMVGFLILILEKNALGLKRIVIGPKGMGYGRAALKEMETQYSRKGCERIWLDVFSENTRARRLYESAGYRLMQESLFFDRPLLIYEKRL